MDIDELLRRLFGLKYEDTIGGEKYEHDLIWGTERRTKVQDAVRGWAVSQDANKVMLQKEQETAKLHNTIGELSAKVYAYEQIIAKSNFALIIPEEAEKALEKEKEE